MFLRGLEGWHIVIIVALLAILFGSRRMPGAARSLGQSLRIFKSEIKAAKDDDPQQAPASAPASIEHRPEPSPQRTVQHESDSVSASGRR
jgi:sec-independent protein translocase protein TatA